MANKSGGDAIQGNAAMQGNMSAQGLNSIGAAGAGVLESMGGSAMSEAMGSQTVTQHQNQGNLASTGNAGSDNIHSDTNINI